MRTAVEELVIESRKVIDFDEFSSLFATDKKAIVSVGNSELGYHAIVVDKIEEGRVYVRDPLPLNNGSSYSVPIEDFEILFNKKAVFLKKQL